VIYTTEPIKYYNRPIGMYRLLFEETFIMQLKPRKQTFIELQ